MIKIRTRILFTILLSLFMVAGCKSDPKEVRDKSYASAQKYMADHKYEEAIIEFRNALQADNGYVPSYIGIGKAFQQMGDHDHAIAAFQRAINLDNSNIEARLLLGKYQIAAGPGQPEAFKRAQENAEEVLKADPSNVDGMLLLGNSYVGQNEIEKAIEQFEKALAQDPQNLQASLNLAFAEARNKNPQKAEEIIKSILESHPDSIEVDIAVAQFYALQNKPEDVQIYLEKAFDLDPADPRSLDALSRFFLAQKKTVEAENMFKKAIERKPKERLPLWGLANLYRSLGKTDAALETLNKLLAVSPGDRSAQLLMADIYLSQGKTDAALETLNKVLEAFPGDRSAQLRLAEIYQNQGNDEKAETYIQKVLKSNSNDAQAHYMLGAILRKRNERDKALEEFNKAIELNTNPEQQYLQKAYLEKANIELSKGDLEACGSTLQTALQRHNNFLNVRAAMAKLLVIRGNPKEALQQAQDVLEKMPTNEDALGARAEALRSLGRFDESKNDWLKLCEMRPQNASYRYYLGLVESSKKEYGAALEDFRRAVALKPDYPNAISGIVYIHLQNKKYEEALNELARLGDNGSPKDEIYNFRGQIFMAKNDQASAEKEWQKAIDTNPQNYRAYALLGQLYQKQNRIPQAIKELDKLLAKNDKLIPVYLQKAYYLQLSNNTKNAIENYRKALELDTKMDTLRVFALNNLAWLLAEDGTNLEEALSLAKEAKKERPEDPEIADTLGWIYYKLKNYSMAASQLSISVNNRKDPKAENYYRLGMAFKEKGDLLRAKQAMRKALKLDSNFDGAEEARKILKAEG